MLDVVVAVQYVGKWKEYWGVNLEWGAMGYRATSYERVWRWWV